MNLHLFASMSSFSENLSLVQSLSLASNDWMDSPWPLSGLLLKLLGIAGCKILLLGISLAVWLFYLYRISPPESRGPKLILPLLFLPLCLSRDLFRGTIATSSDPYFSLFLWTLFFILLSWLIRTKEVLVAIGLGLWLFLWPWVDVSWIWAYALTVGVLVFLSGPGKIRSGGVVFALAGVSLMCRRNSLPELGLYFAALSSEAESGLRYSCGMISPNFQIRRELVLQMAILAISGKRNSIAEIVACLLVVSGALVSELGIVPLGLWAAYSVYMIFERDPSGNIFNLPALRWAAAAMLIVLPGGLIAGRDDPYNYQHAARSVLSRLSVEQRALGVLEDFRVSNSVIQYGGRPFLDLRNPEAQKERADDYASILRLGDGYENLLQKYEVDALFLPADAPLANLLRERAGWREVVRGKAVPMLSRGITRDTAFAFFERAKGT